MKIPETEYELIQAISGVDQHGNGKCTISIQPQRCDADGNIVNVDDEYVTEKPVVQVFKQAGGYVLVDFIFDSIHDVDLQRMYSYFKGFFDATNSTTDDELDFPLLVISFVPNALNGECFSMGINPIFYALTPDDTTGEPKILRVVFVCQGDGDAVPNFLFLYSDADELDSIRDEEEVEDIEPIN